MATGQNESHGLCTTQVKALRLGTVPPVPTVPLSPRTAMRSLFFAALAIAAAPLFSGCDSADNGGFAPTANGEPVQDLPQISGPGQLDLDCQGTYTFTSSSSGTFSIATGAAYIASQSTSSNPRTATVYGSGGAFRIVFTPTGSSMPSGARNVTANPMLACVPS